MRIIAGPCQHETMGDSFAIAYKCKTDCDKYGFDYYFKASYDKANRTSIDGKRGLGFSRTMEDFMAIKQEIPDLKIVTDFHSVREIEDMMFDFPDAVDVVQIPAFLCRQTDLIRAAVGTGKIVNIKKGQFLAPWDVKGILSKTQGANEVWITERGTSFGYNNLVVDFAGMEYCLRSYNIPFIYDATHSVQKPSINGGSSGGDRTYVVPLLRAASALGVSNFFLEVHPDPDNAPSDGPNMLKLDNFDEALYNIAQYHYDPRNTG